MAACRFCRSPLRHTFLDLGMSPLCESFLSVVAGCSAPRASEPEVARHECFGY